MYMKKFGKELMDAEPDRTTELIRNLCTGSSLAGEFVDIL